MFRLALMLILVASPALAASDPDWPCVSPRRDHLSIGQMWTGPVPDDATAALARDPGIAALADRLVQRRLTVEELTPLIDDFAATADDAQLTALFQAVFDRTESRRVTVIGGIGKFVSGQRKLAAQIENARTTMAALPADDFDAIDAAEANLDIATRIFTERQRQISYVCEVPTLLEQRLFALSRVIAGHLGD